MSVSCWPRGTDGRERHNKPRELQGPGGLDWRWASEAWLQPGDVGLEQGGCSWKQTHFLASLPYHGDLPAGLRPHPSLRNHHFTGYVLLVRSLHRRAGLGRCPWAQGRKQEAEATTPRELPSQSWASARLSGSCWPGWPAQRWQRWVVMETLLSSSRLSPGATEAAIFSSMLPECLTQWDARP